jgi:hypothetical protein
MVPAAAVQSQQNQLHMFLAGMVLAEAGQNL